ncbi:MAG: S-layer homology domain-containing protein, partial [Chloroflexia bacterium]
MSSIKRPVHKGHIFAFSALLLVTALAFVVAPASSEAAGGARLSWAGQDAFASINSRLSPLVPPVFGPNVRANTDTTNFGQHEPSLAVSRVNTNTVFVAAKDYREGNIKRVWIDGSTDGGVTWPVQLRMPNLPTTESESDPVVMARDDGRIYVSCLTTGNNGIFITWTDNDGQTWQPSVPIVQNQSGLQDKDWFAIDNNPASPYYHRMYMMYAPDAASVVEHHSTDGGLTWSARQQIGASNTEYTYPVVASDGTVYNFMMLNWGPSRVGTVQMTKSTNGGVSWTTPTTVTTAQQPASPIRAQDQFRFFAILSAAVDPNTGALYVAWTDNRNFGTNGTDVVYVKSADGGATWSPVTRLSHDPTSVVRDHITPMLVVGEDSRLHAFWLDRRLDPNNRRFDSWYSSSTDGGATWDPDTRVSTEPQDLNVGFPPGSGNAAGDYWGLDVWRDTVYVAWNDARLNGQQDILVSKGLMQGAITPTPSPTLTVVQPTLTATTVPATSTSTVVPLTVTATNSPLSNTPTATVIPPQSCMPRWVLGPSITLGSVRNMLEGVDALSADDIWAVGSYSSEVPDYDGRRTLIQHWDGTQWTTVASPNPSTETNILYAVHARSATDVWAVGEYDSAPGSLQSPRTLTIHWDGSNWSVVPSPSRGTVLGSILRDVVAIGPNDVWAVGHSFGEPLAPLIMHWDGNQWSISEAVQSTGYACYLAGIDAVSSTDVWAVGYCDSVQGPPFISLTMHWNGSMWNHVPSPSPGDVNRISSLSDVEAVSSNDVWAVGYYEVNDGAGSTISKSLIVRWNGTAWTQVVSPNLPSVGNGLYGVSVISANDIWAVGSWWRSSAEGQPLTIHWDGNQWSYVGSPEVGTGRNSLSDVSALTSQNVWAVGIVQPQGASVPSRTLIEHYSLDQFGDVPPSNTFYPNVQCLACRGIISGYSDGTFRPNNPVTRGQLAKIVSNSAGFSEAVSGQTFQDVPPTHTFYEFIERLTNRGYMTGYVCGGPGEPCIENRPYFRPQANATRGQTSKIVSNAAGFT